MSSQHALGIKWVLEECLRKKREIIMTSKSLVWATSRCQVSDKRNSVGEVRNAGEGGRKKGGVRREKEGQERQEGMWP